MPFITISTMFLLAGVFTGGALLSWYLNDRKNERERSRLEESMTRALEKRYEVYEDLEQSFHRIFTRMDEVRERWTEQMSSVQLSVEGSLGETTFVREGVEELVGRVDQMGAELHGKLEAVLAMTNGLPGGVIATAGTGVTCEPNHTLMRVENPELWDLERAFERRNAEQLAEISAKSERVQQLMDKIDMLEPMSLQLLERDSEFVALEDDFQRLEDQLADMEREGADLAKTNAALEETRRARVAELSQRIEELELVEVEAGELRKQVSAMRTEGAALSTEVEGLNTQVAEHEHQIAEHKAKVTELECKYAEASIELEGVRADHSTAIEIAGVERVRFESELDQRQGMIDTLNETICDHEATIAELRVRTESLEQRTASLSSDVSSRDEMVADRERRLNELQSELSGLRAEIEQRATELDERERKFEELQGAWQMATGQVELQRSKLASHMNHFQAAQQMLSQLKPMLEELETRLITEDGDETTVVVTDSMTGDELLVNDGSLEELPMETTEVVSVDEPAAALPAQAEEQAVESPEKVAQTDFGAGAYDDDRDLV